MPAWKYPTAGEILIGGKGVNDLTPREAPTLPWVVQSYALVSASFRFLHNNIAFLKRQENVPKNLHNEKVEWACHCLAIGAFTKSESRATNSPVVTGSAWPWPEPSSAARGVHAG